MKRLQLILIGAAGAVLGLFVLLLSGVLNFAASSGHWDVTDWVFDIAARQSVTLRSAGIEVPDLEDDVLIRHGAGHYEMVCAACHGSPARPPEPFATQLTPKPPLLVEQMQHWRPPARVFWTVKHGIKRTGMPAWPTQLRDDEVWAVVAFIEAMPGLTAEDYRTLAGDRRAVASCVNCHGEDGIGSGAVPRLDTQSPAYLADALAAFRDGARASGIMQTAAAGLSDAQIEELAATYARGVAATSSDGASRGAEIAQHGVPERDVPACDSCHGDRARTDYPRLAGQHADYIRGQLELFAELGADRGGKHAGIMAEAVRGLEPDEMKAVAAWYGR